MKKTVNNKYAPLFEPLILRGKLIKNRFEAAPVSMGPVKKGELPCEQVLSELECCSSGNFGIYVIGEVFVDDWGNRRVPLDSYDFSDLSEANLLPYKAAADILKKNGCVPVIELSHCGAHREGEAYGPDAFVAEDGTKVHAMDEAMIENVCRNFANAAVFMKKAGFDGVMAHFGHGWLVHQFLSPMTNHRNDKFGGTLENRTRLALMIVQTIRKAVGEDFIIEVRMSGDELMPGGYDFHEFVKIAEILDEYVDIIHVSMGVYGNPVKTREFSSIYHEKGCNAYISQALKASLNHALVSVVGGINDPEVALEIIQSKKADFVALGRQKYADFQFITKLMSGHPEKIYPCIRCFCCFSGPNTSPSQREWKPGCSVNPMHMSYEYMNMPLPERKLRILVAGGGVAGLYFSIIAAQRGQTVQIVEKNGRLGGILHTVSKDVHKEALIRFISALVQNVEQSNIKILMNTDVDASVIRDFSPDVFVAAIGGKPRNLKMQGCSNKKLLSAINVMEKADQLGQRIVILGGGLIGSELAVFLNKMGKEVILTSRGKILQNVYPMHKIAVQGELDKGVVCMEDVDYGEITENGIYVTTQDEKEQFLSADHIIQASGLQVDCEELNRLETMTQGIPFYKIGDCNGIGKIRQATSDAFLLAMQLGCDYRPKPQKSLWL